MDPAELIIIEEAATENYMIESLRYHMGCLEAQHRMNCDSLYQAYKDSRRLNNQGEIN